MVPSITELLAGSRDGEQRGLDRVAPLAYPELRRMAAICLRRERDANTLQPTGLVHEMYLKLAREWVPECENSSHFFGIAMRSMRQVLIQRARARHAGKRGGEASKLSLEDCEAAARSSQGLSELEAALDELGRNNLRRRCVVELRYFGGYTVEEIAGELDVSASTVERELRFAFADLRQYLS